MRVPGWHDQTRAFEDAGKVRTVGLIQEQHPDRCALFMQWKEMDFPVMVDALNLLGVRVVPITVFIDEAGVVRAVNPRPGELEGFASAEAVEVEEQAPESEEWMPPGRPPHGPELLAATNLDEPIKSLNAAAQNNPDNGPLRFRLGVAYRMRYDSPDRRPGDFAKAVEHWSRALELNPNQYIWRRRIQQYGPRLDKPYSFYDWVNTARDEIRARGEEPVELKVEPSGAEFAYPERDGPAREARGDEPENPDPEGRIQRDAKGLIGIEPVVVPTTSDRSGRAYRVHLLMRPSAEAAGHWNNEVAPAVVWFDPPEGWSVDRRLVSPPMPSGEAVSEELRHVEVEIRPTGEERAVTIPGYALYYVCEGAEGVCLYLRQDFEIETGE